MKADSDVADGFHPFACDVSLTFNTSPKTTALFRSVSWAPKRRVTISHPEYNTRAEIIKTTTADLLFIAGCPSQKFRPG